MKRRTALEQELRVDSEASSTKVWVTDTCRKSIESSYQRARTYLSYILTLSTLAFRNLMWVADEYARRNLLLAIAQDLAVDRNVAYTTIELRSGIL